MEYQYNPGVWGPAWIWVLGFLLFMGGLVLVVWFAQMARHADENDTPPHVVPNANPNVNPNVSPNASPPNEPPDGPAAGASK